MTRISINNIATQENAARAYLVFTNTTMAYPKTNDDHAVPTGVLYTAIGLANEACETQGKLNIFEDMRVENLDALYADIGDELGDVQWYAARLCEEAAGHLPRYHELVRRSCEEFNVEHPQPASRSVVRIVVESGNVLGVVKKMMRDGHTWDADKTAEQWKKIETALMVILLETHSFCMRYSAMLGREYPLSSLLHGNVEKLQSRKDRGVLRGDGDKR